MKFKYQILITSLVLSFILWLSLNLNFTYELDRKIPIKINVNRPYAISNIIPLTLDVKFKGKGWSLLRLFTSIKLELNYNVVVGENEQIILFTREYVNEKFALSENLSASYVKPETLIVKFDKYAERYVKLYPDIILECKDGYQTVGKPELDPDSLLIGGSINIIKNLYVLNTAKLIYKNVNSYINQSIKLTDSLSNIIWKSSDVVNVKIKVELTAEKELQNVEIKVSNIPSDKDVLLIPQNINIQLKGGVNQLAVLDNTNIFGALDFMDLLQDTTGSVISKFLLPEGVKIMSSKPEKIQYVIKKKY
ncbi:MAG: hypothetical protein ACRDFC_01225 [Ignavibacteria bacterium]